MMTLTRLSLKFITVFLLGCLLLIRPGNANAYSGLPDMRGVWDTIANGSSSVSTIDVQLGVAFSGSTNGLPLYSGIVNGNAVTYTVASSTNSWHQYYTGTLSVDADGTATMSGTFNQDGSGSYPWTSTKRTKMTYLNAPTITVFTPISGAIGQNVTISGDGFTEVTGVKFNGTAAGYTVNSATSITTTVPNGAATGPISVITVGGVGTSQANFTVFTPTFLEISVDPGVGYLGPLSGLKLNYMLNGPQPYTGSLAVDNGGIALINGLQPGSYSLSLSGSHWLNRVITGINVGEAGMVNVLLANGDADAGNSINLFDFVVLDSNFNSSDPIADLDGSGNVNLFDYVIIDQNFGAQGDKTLQLGSKVNPIDGAEMVWVSAGEFVMGSDTGYSNERPQRPVYLDGYWMYKYEVTVAQYRAFCLATTRSMPTAPSWGWQETHPIVNVNWPDAVAYANWVGGALPTEAQWEKASRGTDGRQYPWGDQWDASKCANVSNSYDGTKPVGSYPTGASPYGCMDMAGNAWEWCADWYDYGYYEFAPGRNPLGPLEGSTRVQRGGAWFSDYGLIYQFRCANRGYYAPTSRFDSFGFRCAKN